MKPFDWSKLRKPGADYTDGKVIGSGNRSPEENKKRLEDLAQRSALSAKVVRERRKFVRKRKKQKH